MASCAPGADALSQVILIIIKSRRFSKRPDCIICTFASLATSCRFHCMKISISTSRVRPCGRRIAFKVGQDSSNQFLFGDLCPPCMRA